MSFFRSMDLYKAIVLVSLILLPLGGWWVLQLDREIADCKQAIRLAERSGGLLEQIGSLQKQIEVVAKNRLSTSEAIRDPRTYFEGQIMRSARGGLAANDFSPKSAKEESARLKGRQRAKDFVVDIGWSRELTVTMDFVYSVLYNCESGARTGEKGPPSVWRLRDLSLVNATNERDVSGNKVPVAELKDLWKIKTMKFARREPTKQ